MLNLAFFNLFLICFDFSYLWLRSSYVDVVPFVARLYDPVKGSARPASSRRRCCTAGFEARAVVELRRR